MGQRGGPQERLESDRMYHFFVTPEQVVNNVIQITGGDVNHITHVLRMKIGEEISISDGNNQEYHCRISQFEADRVLAEVLSVKTGDKELPSRIYLFQALPKADKMEWIVQKAVELGVYQIVPVETNRCVVRYDAKKAAAKQKRWQSIAQSAAKQAGRSVIPAVLPVTTWKQALALFDQDVRLIPYELATGMDGTRAILDGIKPGQSVAVMIGPEGGFTQTEVEDAQYAGALAVTLGKRILRTETAGLATLSILGYLLEQ